MGGHAGGSAHLQNYQAVLTLPACAVLAEASRGEDRCHYGSGKPLWLALSSFHPPDTSIAADFHAEGQESPIVDPDQATGNQLCL